MFYETKDNKHGLPRDPFKSCIVPRPIGWITTLSAEGKHNRSRLAAGSHEHGG